MYIELVPTVLAVSGAISLVGGAILTVLRLIARAEVKKRLANASILHEAKEAANAVRLEMEHEVRLLNEKLNNLELNINKDLSHMKETYETEMKALGEKIENLREDARAHHGQIMSFLSNMFDNR